jgi:hypothetical protein
VTVILHPSSFILRLEPAAKLGILGAAVAKAISYTFFVAEAEYPRLQEACPGDFPYSYAEYCARIDAAIKETADTVAIEKVYVSVEKFLAWCAEANVRPSNISRARYAAAMGYPWGTEGPTGG